MIFDVVFCAVINRVFILVMYFFEYIHYWGLVVQCFCITSANLKACQRVCGSMLHACAVENIKVELKQTETPKASFSEASVIVSSPLGAR